MQESSLAANRRRHASTRPLGNRGVKVSVLGQGGASLGDLYVKISNSDAFGSLSAAHEAGISLFDTAPWYGLGLSEARFGLGLHSVPRNSFMLQTKVGRFLIPDRNAQNGTAFGWIGGYHMRVKYDYSALAFRRQLQDSLARTGLGYVDSLVIHDCEPTVHIVENVSDGVAEANAHLEVLRASGFGELLRMRREGTIRAFGAGMNSNEAGEDAAKKRSWNRHYMKELVKMGDDSQEDGGIDFMLLANMWSLLNHEALEDGILQVCEKNKISVIVGGPYSSGILATGADPANGSVPYYNYEKASDEVRARCRRIEAVCKSHGIPLIAAALQFPLLHPVVASVIPGGKNPFEVKSNVASMNVDIPDALWDELRAKKLIPTW